MSDTRQLAQPVLPAALIAAFIGTTLAANWAVSQFGLIPAGFGLMVPAGTYCAGLALALRDGIHETAGPWWVLGAILTGAGLSFWVASPQLAVASGAAFLLSELLDFAAYAPLRRRSWMAAVLVSNLAGAAVDTYVFLNLAGFPVAGEAFAGQVLAKFVYVAPVALLLVWAARAWVARHRPVVLCAT